MADAAADAALAALVQTCLAEAEAERSDPQPAVEDAAAADVSGAAAVACAALAGCACAGAAAQLRADEDTYERKRLDMYRIIGGVLPVDTPAMQRYKDSRPAAPQPPVDDPTLPHRLRKCMDRADRVAARAEGLLPQSVGGSRFAQLTRPPAVRPPPPQPAPVRIRAALSPRRGAPQRGVLSPVRGSLG
eukprot:TRINITY_DN33700_c0_g1_i1.p2 TRINITY_DN33700_c0_g1~~TRINITY_DN33700_c0_g1_i1.p2  ORF type:complete len:206 (+),score=61.79 TRINITY_DN33700_c0_g1_i1:52-618(+)